MKSVMIEALMEETYRIAFVKDGRFFTLTLKRIEKEWHIYISNLELFSNNQEMVQLMSMLLQTPKVKQTFERNNIDINTLIFHPYDSGKEELGDFTFLFN